LASNRYSEYTVEFTNPCISSLERYIQTCGWGLVSKLAEISFFC